MSTSRDVLQVYFQNPQYKTISCGLEYRLLQRILRVHLEHLSGCAHVIIMQTCLKTPITCKPKFCVKSPLSNCDSIMHYDLKTDFGIIIMLPVYNDYWDFIFFRCIGWRNYVRFFRVCREAHLKRRAHLNHSSLQITLLKIGPASKQASKQQ